MSEIDALADAIDASNGLPVPTPRGYALRIEEQLGRRGYRIFPVDDEGYPFNTAQYAQPVDNSVDSSGASVASPEA